MQLHISPKCVEGASTPPLMLHKIASYHLQNGGEIYEPHLYKITLPVATYFLLLSLSFLIVPPHTRGIYMVTNDLLAL